MGIYIKGMEMPKSPVLFCIHPDGKVFADLEGGWKEYKSREIPPHGDLIDIDKVLDHLPEHYGKKELEDAIATAPTIIEAEEGEG